MHESPVNPVAGDLEHPRKATTRPFGSDPIHQMLRGAIFVALALGLVLYFVGLQEGRSELETLRANDEQQLQRVQAQRSALEALSQLLAARDWLYRSTIDLNRGNYDLANRDLKMAGSILGTIHPASAGVDPGRLEVLRDEIATMIPRVTADRHALSRRIVRWTEQMNALLPEQVASVAVR